MAVKTIRPQGNLGSEQTEDIYSRGIWHDCPLEEIRTGELAGIVFEENFDALPTTPPTTEGAFGRYTVFTSTGGFLNALSSGRGWNLGSDGDNEGASFRAKSSGFSISRSAKKLWFETAVKFSTIADTKNGLLTGLMGDSALTAILPLTAAGALADINLVGFHRLEGDGDAIDTVYKADGVTAVTVGADAITIAADTWYKLGMVFEPGTDPLIQDPTLTLAKYNLKFFKNGIALADRKQIPSAAGTDFPNDVPLSPFLAVLNATGTTPGDNSVRRMRCVQLY